MRVLLAEDHLIVRQSIKLYLESKGIAVVGEVANGREAVEMNRSLQPDVIVMDIQMSELTGIEATRRIRHEDEHVHILVLTAYNQPAYIEALLDAGADGFVLKTAALSEFYNALQEVALGRSAFDSEAVHQALEYRQQHSQTEQTEALTRREVEVLSQAAHGLTNKAIGKVLFVSDRTIQGHLQNIYQKLHVTTRTEAVTKALDLRLIVSESSSDSSVTLRRE